MLWKQQRKVLDKHFTGHTSSRGIDRISRQALGSQPAAASSAPRAPGKGGESRPSHAGEALFGPQEEAGLARRTASRPTQRIGPPRSCRYERSQKPQALAQCGLLYYALPGGGFGVPSGHWMSTFGGKGGSFIAAVFGISPP